MSRIHALRRVLATRADVLVPGAHVAARAALLRLEGRLDLDGLLIWLESKIPSLEDLEGAVPDLVDAVAGLSPEAGPLALLFSSHGEARGAAAARLAEHHPWAREIAGTDRDAAVLARLGPELEEEFQHYFWLYPLIRLPRDADFGQRRVSWLEAVLRFVGRPGNAGLADDLFHLSLQVPAGLRKLVARAVAGMDRPEWAAAARGRKDDHIQMLASGDEEVFRAGFHLFLSAKKNGGQSPPLLPEPSPGDPLLFLLGVVTDHARPQVARAVALCRGKAWSPLIRGEPGDFRRIAESGLVNAIVPLIGGLYREQSRLVAAGAIAILAARDRSALTVHRRLVRGLWPTRHQDHEARTGSHTDYDICYVHQDETAMAHTDQSGGDAVPFPGCER